MGNVPYVSVIGGKMYAMLCTHPNIYLAVDLICCYQSNLGLANWYAIKRVKRYLLGTADLVLCCNALTPLSRESYQ